MPGSLGETLDALEADHAFLTKGGVFSEELIRTWIGWKRENEVDVVGFARTRPSSSSTTTRSGMTADLPPVVIRRARPGDWPRVAAIYAAGIATGNATFETEVPSFEAWDASHLPEHRFVATEGDGVVGWAALSAYSDRCCYEGVADLSVYVEPAAQGRGVGRALLEQLVADAERAGIWTLRRVCSRRTPPRSPSTGAAASGSSAHGSGSAASTASGGTSSCSSGAHRHWTSGGGSGYGVQVAIERGRVGVTRRARSPFSAVVPPCATSSSTAAGRSTTPAGAGRSTSPGHIPGAVFLDVERDLSARPGRRDAIRFPTADDFARAAGRPGSEPASSSSRTARSAGPSGSGGSCATTATTAAP